MFKWLFFILIFATSGKYQSVEKPLKHQRRLGLTLTMNHGDVTEKLLKDHKLTHKNEFKIFGDLRGCAMHSFFKLPKS